MNELMDRVVVDGIVAVLYSPGYGSGWSTWNRDHPQCVFDPVVVKWVQAGKPSQEVGALETHVYNTYGPDFYVSSNLDQLEIKWLPQGTEFMVEEYDGSESIRTRDGTPWITA
jgi:hypothetical protein